jgi:3-(3-hydroxy-phenyl)propionate hydroxylase
VNGWLAEHGAQALVLRPDRYVMGLARTAADLDRLTRLVPS